VEFAARRRELEARLDALVAEGRHFSDPDNARLAKRLRKHLFTFLDVEATNYRAEQARRWWCARRGTVTGRGGTRTHAVLARLLMTANQGGWPR